MFFNVLKGCFMNVSAESRGANAPGRRARAAIARTAEWLGVSSDGATG